MLLTKLKLLCQDKDEVAAEYALRDESKPLGIAAYELAEALTEELKTNVPTIEQIEQAFEKRGD